MDLIVELNVAGKTIVLATHDLDTLDRLADRCLVFSEAHRIVAEGPPGEVLADRHLLFDVNLIHEHSHAHGTEIHSNPRGLDHHESHPAPGEPHPTRGAGPVVDAAG